MPALVVGGLILVAALLVWRRPQGAAHPPGPPRLAVLPFENLGDSADAYFADGVTDELRGKLAGVAGLEVVASLSSNDYRGSTRRLPEIARELGVDYLLIGKIRWRRGAAGSSRVRVSPELIRLAPDTPPTTRWQQPIDAALTDVFAVQADIAAKVADALGVVLGDSARRELTTKPTESLAAYDEYLKGEAASQAMKADQAGLRRAIRYFERAVALDSSFAQAWSQLSRARTSLYSNGVPNPALGEEARLAAERARALRPADPLVYLALGDLYGSVNPIDNERAVTAYERGLGLAPDNVDLLGALSMAETSLGRWDGAAVRLARAARLDPRSTTVARRQAAVNLFLRQYPPADSAADRGMALAPTSPAMVSLKVLIAVGQGDLDGARAVIRESVKRIDPLAVYAFIASYQDMYWVLDEPERRAGARGIAQRVRRRPGGLGSGPDSASMSSAGTDGACSPMPTRRGSRSRSRCGPHPRMGSAVCSSGWRWRIWGAGRKPSGRGYGEWRWCRSAGTPTSAPTISSSWCGSTC